MVTQFTLETPEGGQVLGTSYEDVRFDLGNLGQVDVISATTSGPLSLHLLNTGANALDYKVLGSNKRTLDVADWMEVVAETALAAGATADEFVDIARFAFYKLQAKSASGATIEAYVAHKRV